MSPDRFKFKISSNHGYEGKFDMLSTFIVIFGMTSYLLTSIFTGSIYSTSVLFLIIIGISIPCSYLASVYPIVIYTFFGFQMIFCLITIVIVGTNNLYWLFLYVYCLPLSITSYIYANRFSQNEL